MHNLNDNLLSPLMAHSRHHRRANPCLLLTQSGHSDTSDFDLDQIQGRRARTMVNNGLAFSEPEFSTDLTRVMSVCWRAGSRSNAQEGAVQLTSNRQRCDSKSSLCSSVEGATRGRASIEILQPNSSANQKFSSSDACKKSNPISQFSSKRIARSIPRNPAC